VSNNPDEQPFAGIPLFGDLAKAMAGQGPLQWDVARQVAISTATNGTNTEANVDPSSRVSLEQLAPIADMHVRNYTGLVQAPHFPTLLSPITPHGCTTLSSPTSHFLLNSQLP
jgi:hypothetical protein